MTAEEFYSLDDPKKGAFLLKEGVKITDRIYAGLHIHLYQAGEFYVEVYFNPKYEIIQGFRAFQEDEGLQPYLDQVNITDVIDQTTNSN